MSWHGIDIYMVYHREQSKFNSIPSKYYFVSKNISSRQSYSMINQGAFLWSLVKIYPVVWELSFKGNYDTTQLHDMLWWANNEMAYCKNWTGSCEMYHRQIDNAINRAKSYHNVKTIKVTHCQAKLDGTSDPQSHSFIQYSPSITIIIYLMTSRLGVK